MSTWNDFVTAALLGTEKGSLPPLPVSLTETLAPAEGLERETQFLTRAGALALFRRAGWKPSADETVITAAETETLPLMSRASAGHLRAMLSGSCAAVLPEWLAEAARLQRRVPAELLPALFESAKRAKELRPLVMTTGGRRAAWLSTQNSNWSFATTDESDSWETGSTDQRVAVLRARRASTPAEARADLETIWKTEPAETRTAFLKELRTNLSGDDEPFLESLLEDRSKEVRRIAIDLLARLPGSAFVGRMKSRLAPLLVFKPGRLLSKGSLEVTLPGELDAAATRDGLDPKAFGSQKTLGEKSVVLVLMLSAVPPQHWADTFQQSPAALIKAAEKSEFGRAVATGWTWAALRYHDSAWAEALLDRPLEAHTEFLPGESLLTLLPESQRAERLVAAIRAGHLKQWDSPSAQALAGQLTAFSSYWPLPLAREVLTAFRAAAANGIPWHLRNLAETLLLRLPPSILSEAIEGWPMDKEGVTAITELLSFRQNALATLAQP